MSSISSTANAGLYQFIQGLSSQSTTSTASDTSAAGISPSTSTDSSGTTQAAGAHHHHHGNGGFGKIADAVTSALQSAGTDGSDSTDPNQAITNALTQLFQGSAAGSTTGTTASAATTVAATGATASGTEATLGSNAASFEQTLKSYGISQQQFQTDLQTAIKNAQASGNFDSSSVPTGSLVDATA